jgi:transcriptional regulator of acetoin/glycerol metabolism
MARARPSRVELDDAQLRRLVAAGTGTRRELAQQLGLSERTLYRRLKALGLA